MTADPRRSKRASGWEKVARPAERAVAVMQACGDCFFVERFESRWGTEAMQQLLEAKVVRLLPKVQVLILDPQYRVEDQWELRFGEEHGKAALRRYVERRQRAQLANYRGALADVRSGELEAPAAVVRDWRRTYRRLQQQERRRLSA